MSPEQDYRLTPDRLIGCVRSVAKTIAWGTIPMGALAAGFLASGIGAQASMAVLAVILIVPAVVANVAPGMRTVTD